MVNEEPVISDLYRAQFRFNAIEIGTIPPAHCVIEEGSIAMLLQMTEHKKYMEFKLLCGDRACQLFLTKKTYLERFNVLFESIR